MVAVCQSWRMIWHVVRADTVSTSGTATIRDSNSHSTYANLFGLELCRKPVLAAQFFPRYGILAAESLGVTVRKLRR